MSRAIKYLLTAASVTIFGSTMAYAQGMEPIRTDPSAHIPSWSELENAEGERAREDLPTRDYDYQRQRDRRDRRSITADGRELELSRQERRAVAEIENALSEEDYEKAGELISSNLEAAGTADAKYTFAALQLRLGYDMQEVTLQDRAVNAAIESGAAPASLLPSLYRHQGISALKAADYPGAEAALTKLVELAPEDAEAAMLLAETKNRARKPDEALPLFQRAVALKKAADEPVPPEWTRVIEALTARLEEQTAD